jgi:transcriptional regulator with XRE-family HTH domain
MKVTEAFATVLRNRRTDAGLTQAELALRSGLHTNFISRLELGKTQPTLESLIALARAMEVGAADLVRDTESLTTATRRAPRPKQA